MKKINIIRLLIRFFKKKDAKPLADNEKATTFAPAFEKQRHGGGTMKRGSLSGEWLRNQPIAAQKKLKKVLAGTGKAITFATRFRKGNDKDSEAKPRDKFYDIMSTKER